MCVCVCMCIFIYTYTHRRDFVRVCMRVCEGAVHQ